MFAILAFVKKFLLVEQSAFNRKRFDLTVIDYDKRPEWSERRKVRNTNKRKENEKEKKEEEPTFEHQGMWQGEEKDKTADKKED